MPIVSRLQGDARHRPGFNTVNDALKGLGVELLVSPVTPRRVVEAIRAGRGS